MLAAQWTEQRREDWARHPHPSFVTAGQARLLACERAEHTQALRSLPRKGLITPAELRRTLSRTAAAPVFPVGPDTLMSGTGEVGGHDPYQASPVPPALAVAAARRAQAPGATALLRGRWRPAAVRHGRSAMCRIGQDLKPPPRMPAQDRVRAWSLRGHLPRAARPSLSQAAPVAASRRFTRGS